MLPDPKEFCIGVVLPEYETTDQIKVQDDRNMFSSMNTNEIKDFTDVDIMPSSSICGNE